jgi:hypothetical protein
MLRGCMRLIDQPPSSADERRRGQGSGGGHSIAVQRAAAHLEHAPGRLAQPATQLCDSALPMRGLATG